MSTEQIDDEQDDAAEANTPDGAKAEDLTIPAAEFEALKKDAAEWRERCLRSQAEFDNVRKRLRKEADEAGTRAVARFVKPLLNEIDNLERALASAKPESFNEFAQGVTMIRENLLSALSGAGIEPIITEGAFDPAVHEVIAETESDEVPKGHILQVFRRGWKLKDQLVRSAQVVVAKPSADG